MRLLHLPFLCIFMFFTAIMHSQLVPHKYGELIIQLNKDVTIEEYERSFQRSSNFNIQPIRLLSKTANIWLVSFDFARVNEYQLLSRIRKSGEVITAQLNHRIEEREVIPNDTRFTEQWMWLNTSQSGGMVGADISLTKAWDFTTGGVTSAGDTIVVAVLDSGVDLDHLDLWPNVWRNHGEIPGDGIDNDGNGFIDDVYGWNFSTGSNAVNNNRDHGTAVAGMIGAVGNNSFGVTGVNWNVKIMNLVRRGVFEDAVIEGYDYALQMRIRYNETSGEEGAYVVAMNSSFGIDRGQPSESPIWCSFYDLMGTHGIINCGATSNNPINVDLDGDLPTACPSDYLISVAATDHNDQRNFSGFGLLSVDLAAPGQSVFTLSNNGGFRPQTGTSFASPTVAGLVALLYALPCPNLEQLRKENPAAFAEIIRDAVFQGVDQIPELRSETKFGGRINAFKSMQIMANFCSSCPTVVTSETVSLTNTSGTVSWEYFGNIEQTNIQFRKKGDQNWIDIIDVSSPYTFDNLNIDETYEYRYINICNGEFSDVSAIFEFSTLGGCGIIDINSIDTINGDGYIITWANNFNISYEIQVKPVSEFEWITYLTSDTSIILSGLISCKDYEARIKPFCLNEITEFSESFFFSTIGCENCSEREYCIPEIADNFGEFIQNITLNDWFYNNNEVGAFFESNPFINTVLHIASEYEITMTPGFTDQIYDETMKAWIDFNGDGIFQENELIINSETPTSETIRNTFTVPIGSPVGITKVRFVLFDDDNTELGPCDSYEYGFVRDFCISIKNPLCSSVETIDTSNVTMSSATIKWTSNPEFTIGYTYRYRESGTLEWSEEVATIFTTAMLFGLKPCTTYEFQVRNICQFDVSLYETDIIFKTECPVSSIELVNATLNLNIYPNPFNSEITLEFEATTSENTKVQIYNINGNLIRNIELGQLAIGTSNHKIENLFVPSGVYLVIVTSENRIITTKKIIKI